MKPNRAYTLIEVIVALAIISVVAGGLLSALMLSMRQGKESRERVLANILAESAIDELLARPPGSVGPSPGWKVDGEKWTKSFDWRVVRDGIRADTTFLVAVVSPQPEQAQIEVSWKEASGEKKLKFTIEVPHFNLAFKRERPNKVEENWHDPPRERPHTTDPDFIEGDNDHSVTPPPPPEPHDYSEVITCASHKGQLIGQVNRKLDNAKSTEDGLDKKDKNYDAKKAALESYRQQLEGALATLNQQSKDIEKFINDDEDPDGFTCPPDPTIPDPPDLSQIGKDDKDSDDGDS